MLIQDCLQDILDEGELIVSSFSFSFRYLNISVYLIKTQLQYNSDDALLFYEGLMLYFSPYDISFIEIKVNL